MVLLVGDQSNGHFFPIPRVLSPPPRVAAPSLCRLRRVCVAACTLHGVAGSALLAAWLQCCPVLYCTVLYRTLVITLAFAAPGLLSVQPTVAGGLGIYRAPSDGCLRSKCLCCSLQYSVLCAEYNVPLSGCRLLWSTDSTSLVHLLLPASRPKQWSLFSSISQPSLCLFTHYSFCTTILFFKSICIFVQCTGIFICTALEFKQIFPNVHFDHNILSCRAMQMNDDVLYLSNRYCIILLFYTYTLQYS